MLIAVINRPSTVRVARTVAAIQTLGFAITAVVGFTGVIVTELATLEGHPPVSPNGWYAFGGKVGLMMGGSALVAALAVGVPAMLLGRPRPGARGVLVASEALLLLPWVAVGPATLGITDSQVIKGGVVLFLVAVLAVLGPLLLPPTTHWLTPQSQRPRAP